MEKRKQYPKEFKARVALEAVKGIMYRCCCIMKKILNFLIVH